MNKNEEVNFVNKSAGITLAGTLSIPQSDKPVPAVVLIAGFGPNDRDYTLFDTGHKLFVVLADHLLQQGIAVLRYDKRGVGKSTGTFGTQVTSQDLAQDVLAGMAYLKSRPEIDHSNIGLIGHSEGGLIATFVAAHSADVAFVVLMAPALGTSIEHCIEHTALQLRADGASEQFIAYDSQVRKQVLDIVATESDYDKAACQMRAVIDRYLHDLPQEQKREAETMSFGFAINQSNVDDTIALFNSPWFRYFLSCDSTMLLQKITVPVLAINGTLDFIMVAHIVLPLIEHALHSSGHQNFQVTKLPGLNHWFQVCATGAMKEYGASKDTLAPTAVGVMVQWLSAHIK